MQVNSKWMHKTHGKMSKIIFRKLKLKSTMKIAAERERETERNNEDNDNMAHNWTQFKRNGNNVLSAFLFFFDVLMKWKSEWTVSFCFATFSNRERKVMKNGSKKLSKQILLYYFKNSLFEESAIFFCFRCIQFCCILCCRRSFVVHLSSFAFVRQAVSILQLFFSINDNRRCQRPIFRLTFCNVVVGTSNETSMITMS